MNKDFNKIGDFKLEDSLKGWIVVDTATAASKSIEHNKVE